MSLDDEAVVVQAPAGEKAAFSILAERRRQGVFRKRLSLIRDYDVAESCSQKTLALALERPSQLGRYRASRAVAKVLK